MTRLLSFFSVALVAIACQTASANLLSNGSFETPDASGGDVGNSPGAPWAAFGDPNARFTTITEAFDGLQSLKTFGPFDFIGGGVGATQKVPATPGKAYTGEIYVKQQGDDALAGGNFGVIKLEFLDENDMLVDVDGSGEPLLGLNFSESPQFNADSPVDEWTLLGTGGVAPAGTVSVQAVVVQVQLGDGNGAFTGGAIFWDDFTLIESDPVDPLSPGDFNGDGLVDNGDLNLLLGSWGDSTVPAEWVNGFDAPVDNGELNALLSDWGQGTGAPVPEPGAALICLLSTVAAIGRRR